MGEGWGTVSWRERGRKEEGGWGVVIAGSFLALEVEKEEKRKISFSVQRQERKGEGLDQ